MEKSIIIYDTKYVYYESIFHDETNNTYLLS